MMTGAATRCTDRHQFRQSSILQPLAHDPEQHALAKAEWRLPHRHNLEKTDERQGGTTAPDCNVLDRTTGGSDVDTVM